MKKKCYLKKFSWLYLLPLFITFLLAISAPIKISAEVIQYEIITGDYRLEQTDSQAYQIEMLSPGYVDSLSPGDPELPVKYIQFQVPQCSDLSNLTLSVSNKEAVTLPGSYDIIPEPPLIIVGTDQSWGTGKSIVDGRNMFVYGVDTFFPKNAIELLPTISMQNSENQIEAERSILPSSTTVKVIRVAFRPFSYNPVTRTLMLLKRATITLTYNINIPRVSAAKPATDTLPAADILAQPGTGDTYFIVTTNNTVSKSARLNDFIHLKERMGNYVQVVTENDFGSVTGQAPNGTAEKIREWLRTHYDSRGINYALLIGDPNPDDPLDDSDAVGDIPMKMCYPRYFEPDVRESPTDYFYADITGNWDLDGDGLYGVDININNAESPDPAIGPDTFSARWTGELQCDFGENYTFSTFSDDGVRVRIDGILVIDNWTDHSPTYDSSAPQAMTIGRHTITVEYYENFVDSVIRLYWHTTNTNHRENQIIPQDHLFYLDSTSNFVSGGLNVTYYDDINFTGTQVTGVDNVVDHIWSTGDNGSGGREPGAEIYVGRIPVYNNNYTELDAILAKIIHYETDPGNISWRESILLVNEPLNPTTYPTYRMGEAINDFASQPPVNFQTFRIYDRDYSASGGPTPDHMPCSVADVLNEWQNDYGMVAWWTHGWERGANNVFDSVNAPNLHDDTPSFTYQGSCLNGYPEDANNLGYALLRNGGVATVSATRISWSHGAPTAIHTSGCGTDECLGYAYTHEVIANSRAAGEALCLVKGAIPSVGPNEMEFNLYGDPQCYLLSVTPNDSPVAEAGGPYQANEGSTITLDASASSDPEGDALQYRWDKNNDGTWDTSWSSSPTTTIFQCDDYTGEAKVEVMDAVGLTAEDTATVTFVNVNPTVTTLNNPNGNEGQTLNFFASFSDPGCDTYHYDWDFGDGSPHDSGNVSSAGNLSTTHAYGDNSIYTITLTVTDDDGGIGQNYMNALVRNVAPTASIDSISTPNPYAIMSGSTINFTGSFTDPGWLDTHTSLWDFGDGTSASGTLTEENNRPDATGTTTVNKVYTTPGTYTVTLTITDDDGLTGTATMQVTVLGNLNTTGSLILADRSKVYAPYSCGGTYSEVGADGLLKTTTLLVNGNVWMRSRAKIDGNVKISGTCQHQDNTVITGTLQERVPVTIGTIASKSVTYGTTDATVNNNQIATWTPGNYRDGMVRARGIVTLTSGTYNFRSLNLEPDSTMVLNSAAGPIYINIDGQFDIGDRAKQTINGTSNNVLFYSNCAGTIRVGTDTQFAAACLIAPKAIILVNSRTTVKAAICATQLKTEPDCTVNCGM